MRKVIVNSTPLIILCSIGRLDILKELYSDIYIPQAVFEEVTVKDDSICQMIRQESEWIHVENIRDTSEKMMYKAKLHAGEVEVMILAQETKADLAVIDDNAAKKTAKFLGIPVTGTLGVLMKAKEREIITEIKPALMDMKDSGFYVSDSIVEMVLKKMGES